MTWDWTIRATDLAIILATATSPLIAIQVQKILERRGARQLQRELIFKTLMATRAAKLSQAHVDALNSVPVEFYGSGRKLQAIRDEWNHYFDVLESGNESNDYLMDKRNSAFKSMLHRMAIYLGYDFSISDISKIYFPNGHMQAQNDQDQIKAGILSIIKGNSSIPISIKASADPSREG